MADLRQRRMDHARRRRAFARPVAAIAALLVSLSSPSPALAAPRAVTPLADGWRFLQGDPEGAESPTLNDQAWRVDRKSVV